MSSVDWEEVKRLAADFQRAQLSSGAQRLSDRNCIEIISRLIEEKLIEVHFTTDGKEYITPQHLIKEIKDEIFVSGGRINLVDVAKNLTVDLQIISKLASDIEHSDSSVRILNGELINNAYVTTLCLEINEKLQQHGQITVGDLTTQYDLPGDYILGIIERQLGKLIRGIQDKQDRNIFFTHSFVERNLSIVRGALLAITRPMSTTTIMTLCGVPERLFHSAIDRLIERKEMPGTISGKQRTSGTYVPHVYAKSQMEWVQNFYQQNGYLEYQALTRLGISDPMTFIQKNLNKASLLHLDTVAIGEAIMDQVEASVDEAISTASYVKLVQILPTTFEPTDIEILLRKVLQKKDNINNLHTFNSTVVITDQYMRSLGKLFNETVESAAKEFVKSGEYIKSMVNKTQQGKTGTEEKVDVKMERKEERRKKAAEGKGGGGTQGRETKTKSTKKKYMKGKQQQDDSDDDNDAHSKASQKIELIKIKDILDTLQESDIFLDEEDDTLINEISQYLHPLLNKKALEQARVVFESTIASANQSRRKKHVEMQERISDLLLNVRLFEKGVKLFENPEINQQLTKYLLKSICTDIVNEVFLYLAHEHSNLFEDSTELTAEQRVKVLNELPADMREPLLRFHKSVNGSAIDEFLSAAEIAVGPGVSDIIVVRHDKKKERPQMLNLRQQLIEQLNVSEDPPLVLHLASLIVFQGCTQNVLHASGKFVSNIITFLKTYLEEDVYEVLRTYHDLVLRFLSNSEDREAIGRALVDELPRVKEVALAAKKNAGKIKERTASTTSN